MGNVCGSPNEFVGLRLHAELPTICCAIDLRHENSVRTLYVHVKSSNGSRTQIRILPKRWRFAGVMEAAGIEPAKRSRRHPSRHDAHDSRASGHVHGESDLVGEP